MIGPSQQSRVHLALGVTDMRKSINGLSILVADLLEEDPFSGHIFAFCNRRRNMVKVLYWDRNGFCLWCKRLEKERFSWPTEKGDVKKVDLRQFFWLLDGLSIEQEKAHKKLSYSVVF